MIFTAELMGLVTTKMYQDIYANNLEKYFNLNFMKFIVQKTILSLFFQKIFCQKISLFIHYDQD